MGQLLKDNTLKESLNALQDFHRVHDFDYNYINVEIKVLNKYNDEELFDINVDVRVTFDNINQHIDIMWEDSGIKNYKNNGLFGRYNPNFNEMVLDENNNTLEIHSTDSDKLVVIYY